VFVLSGLSSLFCLLLFDEPKCYLLVSIFDCLEG